MAIVHFDSSISDDERRERICRGEIFIYGPTEHGRALVEHARSMIEAAFASRSPEHAQYDMQVEDFAALLGKLKPSFIHHPTSKALVRGIMDDVGADPELTYFDVPKLRTSTSDEYLTTGISLAFPPHRDTWYAAPFCQINWWTPIYDITSDNGMAFHPYYWNRPIKNNSAVYNYYQWNKTRATAHLHVGGASATRPWHRWLRSRSITHPMRVISQHQAGSLCSRPPSCTQRYPIAPVERASVSISGRFIPTT